MGYAGKWAIHPSQVEIANAAFAPTAEEIAHAEQVVAAYREAEAGGRGATSVDGMLVDAAHLRHADAVSRIAGVARPVGADRREDRTMTRTMTLVGFMQAGNITVYSGSWRYPSADLSFLSMEHYQHIACVLEKGRFDCIFFDDRLAMPGVYRNSVADAVRYGARPIKLDLSVVLGGIIAATSRIGVGATYSTTYYDPFHVARTFATLDHLSGGRAAWNVVTSVNDSEAQNFGVENHLAHDERYDRAHEFLEVVTALWDSWGDAIMNPMPRVPPVTTAVRPYRSKRLLGMGGPPVGGEGAIMRARRRPGSRCFRSSVAACSFR
jgi:hypothetical protein